VPAEQHYQNATIAVDRRSFYIAKSMDAKVLHSGSATRLAGTAEGGIVSGAVPPPRSSGAEG
jgi:hypothetical protein